jgi:hypothetical protein
MTDAVDTATTTVSGTESAPSTAPATEPKTVAPVEGQQQAPQESTQAPAIPEAYSFSNLPEGYAISDEQLAAFSPVLKDLGLTQEQADKLVAFDAQRSLEANQAAEQQATQARQQQLETWVGDLKKDPAFGGANFDANVGIANQALATYGTPELKTMLVESGLGSHPEVVRFFHKVGKEISEGSLHRATTNVPAQSWAQRMYPDLNP